MNSKETSSTSMTHKHPGPEGTPCFPKHVEGVAIYNHWKDGKIVGQICSACEGYIWTANPLPEDDGVIQYERW